VPLNIVDELFDILQIDSGNSDGDRDSSSEEETFMHISPCAWAGVQSKLSMRLQGVCNGKQVLLLIDSGSGGGFTSANTIQQLGLATVQIPPAHMTISDGGRS
jgi:hypothetical protein